MIQSRNSDLENYAADFDELKVCVIIPTYNNVTSLPRVIRDVLLYTDRILVVNDGSTDDTLLALKEFPQLALVTYAKNRGKGWALRQGFARALQLGYHYAITIDSDGQHFAKDLPAFLQKVRNAPASIIIGSRNMEQASVPGKSSFGHKFSNFWFWVETGIRCPDTQSGFRLYPLLLLKDMRFYTVKYEFEIEVLVRAAWKGVGIDDVPVTVYYAPAGERISHFRPFKDFTRVSILNTVLVILTIFYIKPRDLLRILFNRQKFRQLIRDQLFNPSESDELKAGSIAFGVFMGIIPIWGFQLLVAIFLAVLFKLNKALVVIAAHVSVPPMIPLVIFLSMKTGALWTGDHVGDLAFSRQISLDVIGKNFQQYLLGSITLAIGAGILAGAISLLYLKLSKRKTPRTA